MDKIISIIIPMRNEAAYISRCLDSVFSQVDLDNFECEVIVVDGLSTDNSREIVEEYQQQHPNLILVNNPDLIVPFGMNRAYSLAKGDVIIRVDGHCEIAPDYVSNCIRHLRVSGVDGVGGPMHTIGESPLSETIAVAMSTVFGVGNSSFRTTKGTTQFVDSIPFPAYSREIIAKVGYYDEEMVRNQDDEYNFRIREAGGKLLLAADVQSTYYSRGSLGKLWKQYYQYGFWKVRVLQKHPKQMSIRQFIPPFFVASLILTCFASFLLPYLWYLFALISGYYLLVDLGASILTASRKGWKHLPMLPVIFPMLHLSYGLGFLIGLVKFANRWGEKAYHKKLTQQLWKKETSD